MTMLDRRQSGRERPWSSTFATLATIVPLMVAGWHLRYPIEALTFLVRGGDWVSRPSATSYGRAVLWLVVAVGILMSWRLLAVIAAGLAVAAEVVVATTAASPNTPLFDMAWLLLPDIAAGLLLAVSFATDVGLKRLKPWGRASLVAAVAVLTLSATIIPLLGDYPDRTAGDTNFMLGFAIRSSTAAYVKVFTMLVTLVLVAASVVGQPPPVRRRVHAVLAAGAASLIVDRLAQPRFGAIPLTALSPRAMAMIAAAIVLAVGIGWVVAREHLVRGGETPAEV